MILPIESFVQVQKKIDALTTLDQRLYTAAKEEYAKVPTKQEYASRLRGI